MSSLSSSSSLGNFYKGGSELPPEPSVESDLAKVAPFTFTVVARMHAAEAKAVEGTVQEESSVTGSEEVMTYRSSCGLDYSMSKVTQAQLEALWVCFSIPLAIKKWVLTWGKLPSNGWENESKIPFSVIMLDCGIRLLLTPFMR